MGRAVQPRRALPGSGPSSSSGQPRPDAAPQVRLPSLDAIPIRYCLPLVVFTATHPAGTTEWDSRHLFVGAAPAPLLSGFPCPQPAGYQQKDFCFRGDGVTNTGAALQPAAVELPSWPSGPCRDHRGQGRPCRDHRGRGQGRVQPGVHPPRSPPPQLRFTALTFPPSFRKPKIITVVLAWPVPRSYWLYSTTRPLHFRPAASWTGQRRACLSL